MYNLNENYFCKQKMSESPQTVFYQTHYKKTANIVGIFSTSYLVTLFRLVTHYCCGHNGRRFARGDCNAVTCKPNQYDNIFEES